MDKHQADAAAEALLAVHRERQELELERKREAEIVSRAQRKRGAWSIAGLLAGAAIGYAVEGSFWPAMLIGLFGGTLVGVLFVK